MKKPGIVVRVDLSTADWKPEASGKGVWSCAALRLPGARFLGLVGAGGRQVDAQWYQRRGRTIVWKGGSNPPTLQAELSFSSPIAARARSFMMLAAAFAIGAFLAHELGPAEMLSLATRALAMIGGGSSTG